MMPSSANKKGRRIQIYIDESDRWRGQSLDAALMETLRHHGASGATIFYGSGGFGAHSLLTSDRSAFSAGKPVIIDVVDTADNIATLMEVISPMVSEGLITQEDIEIVKYTHRFQNPLPADRLVREVMTRDVVSIRKEASIHEVWKQMLKERIKALPVIERGGRVVGMITNEDLLERAGIEHRLSVAIRLDEAEIHQDLNHLQSLDMQVGDIMTQPVITVLETDHLGGASAKMVKAGLKRIPVVNQSKKLVGMLSRLDILRVVAQTHANSQPEPEVHPHAIRAVRDIMTSTIPTVDQNEDLTSIIQKFAGGDSHRLIVTDAEGKAIGLISDSDVIARVQPRKRKNILDALRQIGQPEPGTETAKELMSPGLLTASPNMPVVEAIQLMLAESRKWLVVVDENEKPLGLVNRELLLESMVSNELWKSE